MRMLIPTKELPICEWEGCNEKGWYITVLLHDGGRVEMMACADHVKEFLEDEVCSTS